MTKASGKIRVVIADRNGPLFYQFDSVTDALSCFLAWFRGNCGDKTASLWRQVRGKWVPMFEYHLLVDWL